jgi:WD40 repeat protein
VEGVATLMDAATGAPVARWAAAPPGKALRAAAWRDASTLLTTSDDGAALLWDTRVAAAATQAPPPALRVYAPPPRAASHAAASSSSLSLSSLSSAGPLRLAAWSPAAGGGRLLALAHADAVSALILDVRAGSAGGGVSGGTASNVLAELSLEQGCLNALAWSPQGAHLAGGATDGHMVVWPTPPPGAQPLREPLPPPFGFQADGEINALSWAGPQPGVVAIAHGKTLQVLVV